MIDWTKPIEALDGTAAKLLHVLSHAKYPYVVVFTSPSGYEQIRFLKARECELYVRNVQPPLTLYGRLDNLNPWTKNKGYYDTHVMTLTPDDIKRLIKPIGKGE